MRIILAQKAGFCMGVKRAVELVFKTARKYKNKPVFTLGPIIHNPQVLELLERQGVHILKRPEEAPPDSVVVIRAHGVPPQVKEVLKKRKVTVIDATCPRVIKVQHLIRQFFKKGYKVIIIGEKEHPEVKGLMGYADNQAWVISTPEEIEKLPQAEAILVVAQTTQNEKLFKEMAESIKARYQEVKVFNTICNATHNRQEEVRRLAKLTDAFVVVGGKISGNTRRLAQIAQSCGVKTYHIETEDELPSEEIKQFDTIAVTAGASTPYWLIRRVIYRLEEILASKIPLWWRILYSWLKISLSTNFWAALAGASLAVLGCRLSGIEINKAPFITFFYLWAMHLLNHLTDLKTTYLTDPTRFAFFSRHRFLFTAIGTICIIFALFLSLHQLLAFMFILSLTGLGLIYNVEIPFFKIKLKKLPASKTILVPLTWGMLGSLLPWFLKDIFIPPSSAFLIFLYLSALAFIRTCCYDLLDIQGDQMVGKETLPIVLGEKKSFRLLYILILGFILTSIWLICAYNLPFILLTNAIILISFLIYLWQVEHKHLRPGVLSDALVDGGLILMGLLSLL